MEVWEKYQVSAEFLADPSHGAASCIHCHAGNGGENLTKAEAHVGVLADPSAGDAPGCNCHGRTAINHSKSLHGTQEGYFTSFARRTGTDVVSPDLQRMFDGACGTCHTSCGQCHVSQPASVGGGLISGHQIKKTPNPMRNCMACHGSRISDEYRGANPGYPADVHYLRGKNCMSCHTGDELHGDGTTPPHRYDLRYPLTCVEAECHADIESDTENEQHSIHVATVACQVCHSVGYKNCYNCHVGHGTQFPSRIDFRIGRNTEPSSKRPWEYVVVRHVPIHPESYSDFNVSLPEYASYPTWFYATPHNIQRQTPQNASCEACHGNSGLFLTPEYIDSLIQEGVMVSAEITANEDVVVRDLPQAR